jgi:hypothetical protein
MLAPNNQLHNTFWADVVLAAEAASETFEDVHVVTLRSYFLDVVYDQAILRFLDTGKAWDEAEITAIATLIIETSPPKVSERVIFSDDGLITVVIDVPKITNETVFPAMSLLSKAYDQQRINGIVSLGPDRVFASAALGLTALDSV